MVYEVGEKVRCYIDSKAEEAIIKIGNKCFNKSISRTKKINIESEFDEFTNYILKINKALIGLKVENEAIKDTDLTIVINNKSLVKFMKPDGKLITKLSKRVKKSIDNIEFKKAVGTNLYQISTFKNIDLEFEEFLLEEGDNMSNTENENNILTSRFVYQGNNKKNINSIVEEENDYDFRNILVNTDDDEDFDEDFAEDFSGVVTVCKSTELEENLVEIIEEDDEVIDEKDLLDIKNESANTSQKHDIIEESDLRIKIFKALSEYLPMNMYVDKNNKQEYKSLKKEIVIEKIGEDIVAVENLGRFPFYIKGEKESLVVRSKSLQDYMEWLKNDTIKRYNNGINSNDFDNIEKLIIVESEEDIVELKSNETYITRKEALNRLSQKYDVIIDVTMNNFHIKFNSDDTSCSIDVEGLGYKVASSIDWVEEVSSKLSCLKGRNILFIGIAGKEKLLKDMIEKFDIEKSRNFESLAWEI